MAFFKRELSPVERFEQALKDKQTARQKLADRVSAGEAVVSEKRTAAEKLAVAGAANARLERAEAAMRAVEERARTLRAELADVDEQIVSAERALAEARAQRERDHVADGIEAMAAAIAQAVPGFDAGAAALVAAVTKSATSIPEAARFSASVDAVRREVLSAAELVCFELRSAAVRTRVGNTNVASPAATEPEQPSFPEIERQLIYTLNPLLWREGSEVRRVPAFALVGLPKALLPVALSHQHVEYMNARRVQTLMQVHGSAQLPGDLNPDDPQLVDLDALAAFGQESAKAEVA
jgi:predicted ribonuclease toxin of YeeF-YezG toxin-antitoxin module